MAWFGLRAKRSRTRGQSTKRLTLWQRAVASLTDYSLIGRIALVAMTVAILLVILEAWSVPFPFREGDYFAHGIAARQDFEQIDEEETRRQRDRAALRTPQQFRNDPANLAELHEQLRVDLGRVSAAGAIDDLAIETRRAFGLASAEGADASRPSPEVRDRFIALKKALEPIGQVNTKEQIDGIVSDFAMFILPLNEFGVIDEDDIELLNLVRESRLSILPTIDEESTSSTPIALRANTASLPDVRLEDQLTDGGILGRNWLSYPNLTDDIRPSLVSWLQSQVEPTLTYDEIATQNAEKAARQQVPSVVKRYYENTLLVPPRHLLTEDDLSLLRVEHASAEATRGTLNRTTRFLLLAGLLAVLAAVNGYHVLRSEPRVVQRLARLLIYLATIILAVAFAKQLSLDPWRAEIIPLAIAAMVFAIAYNQVLATALAVTLCVLVTLATTATLPQLITLMAVTTAAVLMIGRVRTRTTLVNVGWLAAIVHLFASLGMRVLASEMPLSLALDASVIGTSLLGSAWCVLSGYLVTGSLPIVERLFGVVTDISLLEMSDPSHPLLRDLVRRAPGTYSHSMSVASISEKAAESIGANGLLCRVAAYFHDCGKMIKPEYFIENVPSDAESRHQSLSPAMSTLVIIGHVKDGVDLAKEHNLPQVLIDFIEQHHGTTLVEYFYRQAIKKAEAEDSGDTEESDFRYPGPKPQTKEAACMMLADCCESASRTLTDPTAKRIAALVESLTMKRLLDGQFEECDMTLAEINTVKQAVSKSLTAMYHGRIKYPDVDEKKSA